MSVPLLVLVPSSSASGSAEVVLAPDDSAMAPQQGGVLGVQAEGESTPCMGSQEAVNPLKVASL